MMKTSFPIVWLFALAVLIVGCSSSQETTAPEATVSSSSSDAIRHALASFMAYGTFDKFPKLKLVILEVGAGWVQYWLDRMDAVYDSVMGRGVPLKEKPSFYFRRNVWVSADFDEKSLPAMVDLCGSDRFFWATDFPHPDHTGNYIEELEEFGNKISDPQRRRDVLGDNVRRVYNVSI